MNQTDAALNLLEDEIAFFEEHLSSLYHMQGQYDRKQRRNAENESQESTQIAKEVDPIEPAAPQAPAPNQAVTCIQNQPTADIRTVEIKHVTKKERKVGVFDALWCLEVLHGIHAGENLWRTDRIDGTDKNKHLMDNLRKAGYTENDVPDFDDPAFKSSIRGKRVNVQVSQNKKGYPETTILA